MALLVKVLNYPIYSDHLKCEVCDGPISYAEFLLGKMHEHLICGSFDCKRIINQKPSMPPSLFKSHLALQRTLLRERQEKHAAKQKYNAEQEVREVEENKKVFASFLSENTNFPKHNIQLLVIPSGRSDSIPLEQERVDNYTEHLKRIISHAADLSESPEILVEQDQSVRDALLKVEEIFLKNPDIRKISDRFCGMCKGGCCSAGNDKAYLTVAIIRRYMAANPDLTEEAILNSYLLYVPSESISFSCINQIATGCALPRELRSDTCNGFYCDSLKSYQKEFANKTELEDTVVIQRFNTLWNRFEQTVANKIVKVVLVHKKD